MQDDYVLNQTFLWAALPQREARDKDQGVNNLFGR